MLTSYHFNGCSKTCFSFRVKRPARALFTEVSRLFKTYLLKSGHWVTRHIAFAEKNLRKCVSYKQLALIEENNNSRTKLKCNTCTGTCVSHCSRGKGGLCSLSSRARRSPGLAGRSEVRRGGLCAHGPLAAASG